MRGSRTLALAGLVATLFASASGAELRPRPRPVPPGEVCGDPTLVGTPLPAITDEGGCGIAAPVRLAVAAGVVLEPPATVACEMARALAAWLLRGPKASFAARGARLDALTVVDAYSCRNRNRAEEGELSEHALGTAIDVGGFRLGDGTSVSVADGWASPSGARRSGGRPTPDAASSEPCSGRTQTRCTPTTLHLDVEQRRSGPYCR